VKELVRAAYYVELILRLAHLKGRVNRLDRSCETPRRLGDPTGLIWAVSRTRKLLAECEPLVCSIREQLVWSSPGFSSRQLHAPTAFDAALTVARRVLGTFDRLRSGYVRRLKALGRSGPNDPTREAKGILRQAARGEWLEKLPPQDQLHAAIDREAILAAGRVGDRGRPPNTTPIQAAAAPPAPAARAGASPSPQAHVGEMRPVPGEVQALHAALSKLLAAYEDEPPRLTRMQSAWTEFYDAFGARDGFALLERVRQLTVLTRAARDAVAWAVDPSLHGRTLCIWDDTPSGCSEAEHRDVVRKLDPDESPLRETRQAIRTALDALLVVDATPPAVDVALDAGTIAAARGMAAHLRTLAAANTTVHGFLAEAAGRAPSPTDPLSAVPKPDTGNVPPAGAAPRRTPKPDTRKTPPGAGASPPRRAGRTKLAESTSAKDLVKRNVYEVIGAAKAENPDFGPVKLKDHLRRNKDFMQSVGEAKLTLTTKLIKAALKWVRRQAGGTKPRGDKSPPQ
jgi:hypothetical protein